MIIITHKTLAKKMKYIKHKPKREKNIVFYLVVSVDELSFHESN